MKKQMTRYLAKLVFNIDIENGENSSQFDEQTRIIEAKSLQDAFFKAKQEGKKEEVIFYNQNNQAVSWKFIDVAELYSLDELKDGEQVYSTTHESVNARTFIDLIKQKSMIIQTNFLTFA